MSVDGIWNLSVSSPMGTQDSVIEIRANGSSLSGTQTDGMGVHEFRQGTVDGDAISWSIAITRPMSMTLTFSCTINGDAIGGRVKAGMFGSFEVTGARLTGRAADKEG